MEIRAPAIVCAILQHGEHGVIVRLLTAEHGLVAGYARGGRSRTMRPVLMPGNSVTIRLQGRLASQLPGLEAELGESRAQLHEEPLAAAALEWVCTLTASTLPEMHPYPRLYAGLDAVLQAIAAAPRARSWAATLARFEALLLAELGYGGAVPEQTEAWDAILAALASNASRIELHLLAGRRDAILAARERLVARLKRAAA